jgi:hypothetical protein
VDHGQEKCPVWEEIAKLCQTESERMFLKKYLSFVKDRQFPMLIPQTWIGIADRRRPDFVGFVPLQHWRYKWVAIQLDASHGDDQVVEDARRDEFVREQNYEVIPLRPTQTGYLEEVRRIAEQFEAWMTLADSNPWEVVVEATVVRFEQADDDLPF